MLLHFVSDCVEQRAPPPPPHTSPSVEVAAPANSALQVLSAQHHVQYQEGGRLMATDHVDKRNEFTLLPTLAT